MKRFQPALLGGLFIGVLSSLPLVNLGNLCCCLWVVVGGVLTVYLQRQGGAVELDVGEAVLGGLIAGAVGGLISMLATSLLFSVSGEAMQAQFRAMLEDPQIPPQMRERLSGLQSGRTLVLLIGAFTLPVFAVFSMLGALLGYAWFRKKTPPPALQS
ncbi:MAG: hypothetical protein ABI051_05235 [Vicinamibacterales bacterium]